MSNDIYKNDRERERERLRENTNFQISGVPWPKLVANSALHANHSASLPQVGLPHGATDAGTIEHKSKASDQTKTVDMIT